MSSEEEDPEIEINKNNGDNDLARQRKIVYERGSDATLEFENGEIMHVNKTALALKSKYFDEAFFGSSPNTNVKIKDFDRETFQTFLDCLFGFKNYSVSDALLIFPVAYKYKIEECLRKCVSILKPTEINEKVCLSLNLAVFYEYEETITDIIAFLENEIGVVALIENKIYSDLLKPKTMSELLDHVTLDSYVWSLIYDWGIRHLENHSKYQDIRSFFAENNILEKLSLFDFESVQSIFEFQNWTGEKLLDSDVVFYFLTQKNYGKVPEKSCWFLYEKGKSLKETILFKNSLVVSSCNYKNGFNLNINIDYKCADMPKGLYNIHIMTVKVRLHFGCVFSKDHEYHRKGFSTVGNDPNVILTKGTLKYALPQYVMKFTVKEKQVLGVKKTISFPLKLAYEFVEIKSVEISYIFSFNVRVLKTSISQNFFPSDGLYFTKDVFFSQREQI